LHDGWCHVQGNSVSLRLGYSLENITEIRSGLKAMVPSWRMQVSIMCNKIHSKFHPFVALFSSFTIMSDKYESIWEEMEFRVVI